jgi:hypothetical protein
MQKKSPTPVGRSPSNYESRASVPDCDGGKLRAVAVRNAIRQWLTRIRAKKIHQENYLACAEVVMQARSQSPRTQSPSSALAGSSCL